MQPLYRYLAAVCLSALITLAGLTWLTGLGLNDLVEPSADRSLAVLGESPNPSK